MGAVRVNLIHPPTNQHLRPCLPRQATVANLVVRYVTLPLYTYGYLRGVVSASLDEPRKDVKDVGDCTIVLNALVYIETVSAALHD